MASDSGRKQNWRQQQHGQSQEQQQEQPVSSHLQAQYVAAGAASPDLEKLSTTELQKFIREVMAGLQSKGLLNCTLSRAGGYIIPFTRRSTKLRLRQFTKSGQYHYVVKVSDSEGVTAQWQHMQRQFHLPFPSIFYYVM
jgi:hypothetical protein